VCFVARMNHQSHWLSMQCDYCRFANIVEHFPLFRLHDVLVLILPASLDDLLSVTSIRLDHGDYVYSTCVVFERSRIRFKLLAQILKTRHKFCQKYNGNLT
jgi:hypothetical protein